MIQRLLAAAQTDIEARSIIGVAFRAGEITREQAEAFSYEHGIEFQA